MIELTTIESLIMAYAPGLTVFIGVIVAFCKMIKTFKQLRMDNLLANVEKNAQITELKNEIKIVLQENYELKKTLKECMSKIDHIRRD